MSNLKHFQLHFQMLKCRSCYQLATWLVIPCKLVFALKVSNYIIASKKEKNKDYYFMFSFTRFDIRRGGRT